MNKICNKCNTLNKQTAKKCRNCGEKFKVSKKHIWRYIILADVVLCVAVVLTFYAYLWNVNKYSAKNVLSDYLSIIAQGDYVKASGFTNLETDGFNGENEIKAFYTDKYGEKASSYIIIPAGEDAETHDKKYKVQYENGIVENYVMSRNGKKGPFGIYEYSLSQIDAGEFANKSLTVSAPEGSTIILNGKQVGEEYITDRNGKIAEYDSLNDQSLAPKVYTYKVDGLLAISSITATDFNGNSCTVDYDEANGTATVSVPMSDQLAAELKPVAENFAKKYCNYITDDAYFGALGGYIYKDTSFYGDTQEFFGGFFSFHSRNWFTDVEYKDLYSYSDTHCSIGVKYDYYVYFDKEDRDVKYPIDYDVYFIKVNNEWKISFLKIN